MIAYRFTSSKSNIRFHGDEVPPVPPAPPAPPGGTPPEKKFTQDDVNRFLAEEKRKSQAEKDSLKKQVDELGLTAKQKSDLEAKLEEQRIANLSEADRQKEMLSSTEKKYQKLLGDEQKKAERYAKLYADDKIDRELLEAAGENEAFRPSQIVAFLRGDTELSEETGEDGKPTGRMTTKVKFPAEVEGKAVVLKLTPKDAVKRMKEDVDKFGNLFKSTMAGGIGGSGNTGVKGKSSIAAMSQADFNKAYRENPGSLGLTNK